MTNESMTEIFEGNKCLFASIGEYNTSTSIGLVQLAIDQDDSKLEDGQEFSFEQ